jgi:hypothetical protein
MQGKLIAGKLHEMGNTILGAMNNSEIQKELERYGFPYERILEGKRLWDKTTQLMTKQVNEYGNQYLATDEQEKFMTSK